MLTTHLIQATSVWQHFALLDKKGLLLLSYRGNKLRVLQRNENVDTFLRKTEPLPVKAHKFAAEVENLFLITMQERFCKAVIKCKCFAVTQNDWVHQKSANATGN